MAWPWQQAAGGIRLRVHLQPRAARNRFVGVHGEAVKIALTAPPVDGAANAALLHFLAAQLGLSVSSVSLLSGERNRNKQVLIRTADAESVIRQLGALIQRVDKKNRDD